jgi:hypothetical protein
MIPSLSETIDRCNKIINNYLDSIPIEDKHRFLEQEFSLIMAKQSLVRAYSVAYPTDLHARRLIKNYDEQLKRLAEAKDKRS